MLTWAASLEKDHATQVSNLESERQLTTTVDNTVDGLALHADSQATEDDNLNFPKKKKNPTQPAPFPRVQTRLRGPPAPMKGKKMLKLS